MAIENYFIKKHNVKNNFWFKGATSLKLLMEINWLLLIFCNGKHVEVPPRSLMLLLKIFYNDY